MFSPFAGNTLAIDVVIDLSLDETFIFFDKPFLTNLLLFDWLIVL